MKTNQHNYTQTYTQQLTEAISALEVFNSRGSLHRELCRESELSLINKIQKLEHKIREVI